MQQGGYDTRIVVAPCAVFGCGLCLQAHQPVNSCVS